MGDVCTVTRWPRCKQGTWLCGNTNRPRPGWEKDRRLRLGHVDYTRRDPIVYIVAAVPSVDSRQANFHRQSILWLPATVATLQVAVWVSRQAPMLIFTRGCKLQISSPRAGICRCTLPSILYSHPLRTFLIAALVGSNIGLCMSGAMSASGHHLWQLPCASAPAEGRTGRADRGQRAESTLAEGWSGTVRRLRRRQTRSSSSVCY